MAVDTLTVDGAVGVDHADSGNYLTTGRGVLS
jgi:hypothetical protein